MRDLGAVDWTWTLWLPASILVSLRFCALDFDTVNAFLGH